MSLLLPLDVSRYLIVAFNNPHFASAEIYFSSLLTNYDGSYSSPAAKTSPAYLALYLEIFLQLQSAESLRNFLIHRLSNLLKYPLGEVQ